MKINDNAFTAQAYNIQLSLTSCGNILKVTISPFLGQIGNAQVRLVGGRNRNQGRVEINLYNRWGTICDDNFGATEAGIVCNMLGISKYVDCYLGDCYYGSRYLHFDSLYKSNLCAD